MQPRALSIRAVRTLLAAAALASGAPVHGALVLAQRARPAPAYPEPSHPTALADYGTSTIRVTWTDNSHNETGFQVFRSVDGGAFENVAITLANVTHYVDTDVSDAHEYRYKVRGANGSGPSGFTEVVRQNLKTVWPVPAAHDVLHNWNETIGTVGLDELGAATGFHMGVDVRRSGAMTTVVAVRSGVVTYAEQDASSEHDGAVMVTTRVGGANGPVFQLNHVHELLVAVHEYVYAGQPLAVVSDHAFPEAVLHTHYVVTDSAWAALPAHPLGVFSAAADRDPLGNPPALTDHPGSPPGTVLFRRQGDAPGIYMTVDATHPLSEDVDIVVEFGDKLGALGDQVPTRLGYWIEKPPMTCAVTYHDVKPGAPYLLFAWEESYFGDAPGALALASALMDTWWDYGDSITGYPSNWPNYKHFVVTNTSGTTGAFAHVSDDQYWRTDAWDDGASEDSAHANYAGRPFTTKAREARFPDGVYTIHLLANDLIQDAGPFIEIPVRLENFAPIVCSVDPPHGAVLPSGVDELPAIFTFNEPMDTGVPPGAMVAISGGAGLHGAEWLSPVTLRVHMSGLVSGGSYVLTVHGHVARDQPGTPGNRPLDGDEDGVGGDSFFSTFSVAP